jgi:hypothetical protein
MGVFGNGVAISTPWCRDETGSLLWRATQGCAARHAQMSRQFRSSSRSHGNTEPSSSPPQPTSTKLLQMLAESQRASDESVRNHVHQEPEPA